MPHHGRRSNVAVAVIASFTDVAVAVIVCSADGEHNSSGRHTGLIVKTDIVPGHDMDLAISWILRFIQNS